MSRSRRLAAAAGLLAALAGCEVDSLNPFAREETRPCPGLSVLRDSGHMTQYRPGAGRDLLDVRYSVDVADVTASCRYDDPQLRMTVNLDLVFTRGPAAEGPAMRADYFVAVTRGGEEILAKRVFESTIEFPENRRRAAVREEIDQVITPLPDEDGGAYEVIVGLQISEEQLQRNRAR